MSNIKIFVTHISNRNDEIVNNPLFINIIAGANNQKGSVPFNFIGDNTGENISAKNSSYCELTSQYWAWKNVVADYYGFCHYRRFLSMSHILCNKNDFNERGQISAKILNEFTAHKYGLDNENEMRNFIEDYDCILPNPQDLSKLSTPNGRKKTVYEHFKAHDRAFMHSQDLDILQSLIAELYPEYLEDAKEYLHGKYFWGYNCFVLKKDLFFKLCEFEFSILSELERKTDMENYNLQMARMPGFMGEILSSIFFYHLKKTCRYLRIAEVPLIYFEKTRKMLPNFSSTNNAMPIVFNIEQIPPVLFFPTIASFNNAYSVQDEWQNIIILHWNISDTFLQYYKKMLEHGKIKVYFINLCDIRDTLSELHLYNVDARILLPWILSQYNRTLCFNWNILFKKEILNIQDEKTENYLVAGSRDILRIGMAYDISDKYEKYLKEKLHIKKIDSVLDPNVFFMNLSNIRNAISVKDVFEIFDNLDLSIPFSEQLTLLFQDKIYFFQSNWNYYYTEDSNIQRIIKQAPVRLYKEYCSSKNSASIITYDPNTLWSLEASDFNIEYWGNVKASNFYHLFLLHFSTLLSANNVSINSNRSLFSKIWGGIKCIRDHGFYYTFCYGLQRLKNI